MKGPSVDHRLRYSILLDLHAQSASQLRFFPYSEYDGCNDGSAFDYHFLIEAAKERFLADMNSAAREPYANLVTPQIECKRLKPGQQRPPHVAKRMPPTRQVIIHNYDLAAWFYDSENLAQRPLAIVAGLLMQ